MLKLSMLTFFLLLCIALPHSAFSAEAGKGLSRDSGGLIRGVLYKQSGMEREGIITIFTEWKLPTPAAPVYRYDFDVIKGTIEGNLYSYLVADIAEMEFLPMEKGAQPVNLKLRNGMIQRIILVEPEGVLGKINLRVKEARVVTEGFGENIISGGDIQKIVFSRPPESGAEDMPRLVDELGWALDVGKRDGLVDKHFLTVLQNLEKNMKAKAAPAVSPAGGK